MKTVRVKLKQNSYSIVIGEGILREAGKRIKALGIGRDAIVVTSAVIRKLHGAKLASSLKRAGFSVKFFEVPDGERAKSAKVAIDLLQRIAQYDIFKQVFVVAFGGGVVGDLAGFVASAYKRGVPYVQIPTTFLAQVDSSIGGKVAIDLPVGKNLVGAFYQPKMVLSDVNILATLSKRQLRNGLAEAVKYGVIYDAKLFQYLEKYYPQVLAADPRVLDHVVTCSSRIKTEVVLADEKETKGIRTILNYGHTIGHAIEAAGRFSSYHHGEAIALGMRVAGYLSVKKAKLSAKSADRIEKLLTDIGLPSQIQKARISDVLRLMRHDKKFVAGKNRFVLATRIGKVKVLEGIPLALIKTSIKKYM